MLYTEKTDNIIRSRRTCMFFGTILCVLLFAVLLAVPSQAASKKITITGSKHVAKGKSIRLSADRDVVWKSSNPKIAKVYKKGKVKGLRPGKVVITAVSKENPAVKAKIKIRVHQKAVKRIRLSVNALALNVTRVPSAQVKAKATPKKAAQKFAWSSSNPSVAKVTSKGVVKALKAGKARITCQAVDGSKKKASFIVTVTDKAKEEAQKKEAVRRKAEEEGKAKAEAERKAKAEAERKAKAEAEQKAKAEAEQKAKAEAERKAKEEAERKAKEEAERKAKEAAEKEAAYWNILLVGNSYTQDEFGYVPALLKQYFPSLKFRIGLLYTGGCSLELHYNNLTRNGAYQQYSEYTSESTKWEHKSGVLLSDVINKYAWKIVTFQQYSRYQDKADTILPYIANLMKGYTEKIGKRPIFLYVFPHVNSAFAQESYGSTADAYVQFVSITKQVLNSSSFRFDGVIPNATAIENARKTSLGVLGNRRDMTSDGTHLQDGMSCLVANYCSFLRLLPYMGLSQPNLNQVLLPTAAWVAAQSVPGADGQSVGATQENWSLAVRCAQMAVQNPLTITNISN